MFIRIVYLFSLFSTLCLAACNGLEESNSTKTTENNLIKYSEKLEIIDKKTHYLVRVKSPWKNSKATFEYILNPNKETLIAKDQQIEIKIPIERLICNSTSHLSAFEALGKSAAVVGFPDTKYIYSSQFQELAAAGQLTDIGSHNQINIELTLQLAPDLAMLYRMGADNSLVKQLEIAGIPVLINADYMENHPLARAEWIKLAALLLGDYAKGDSIFKQIESRYDSLLDLVKHATISQKPTVMSGVMYGDIWYAPAGESWASLIIAEAAGDYLWKNEQGSGSLQLAYENVLEKAHQADFWIGAADFSSFQALQSADKRYAYFGAFKNRQVYTYTKRTNASGANDYLESGYLHADKALADIIHILHPNLLGKYETTYYEKLKE